MLFFMTAALLTELPDEVSPHEITVSRYIGFLAFNKPAGHPVKISQATERLCYLPLFSETGIKDVQFNTQPLFKSWLRLSSISYSLRGDQDSNLNLFLNRKFLDSYLQHSSTLDDSFFNANRYTISPICFTKLLNCFDSTKSF